MLTIISAPLALVRLLLLLLLHVFHQLLLHPQRLPWPRPRLLLPHSMLNAVVVAIQALLLVLPALSALCKMPIIRNVCPLQARPAL